MDIVWRCCKFCLWRINLTILLHISVDKVISRNLNLISDDALLTEAKQPDFICLIIS